VARRRDLPDPRSPRVGAREHTFGLHHEARELACSSCPVPGRHNALNAAGAAAMALEIGSVRRVARPPIFRRCRPPLPVPRRGRGRHARRRLRPLPTEVSAARRRARALATVVAVFQPHRYTRTQGCGATADAFVDADVVVLTDVPGGRGAAARRVGSPRAARGARRASLRAGPYLPPRRRRRTPSAGPPATSCSRSAQVTSRPARRLARSGAPGVVADA
jgi:hypothetical protein